MALHRLLELFSHAISSTRFWACNTGVIASYLLLQTPATLFAGPAPGSLLLLSTHKPGAVISATQLQLPNIAPAAPFWSSPASGDAAMGTWDVAAFVTELGAEPATAAFVARLEPCLSPTCSKSTDGKLPMHQPALQRLSCTCGAVLQSSILSYSEGNAAAVAVKTWMSHSVKYPINGYGACSSRSVLSPCHSSMIHTAQC